MPPRRLSRYTFCAAVEDADGVRFLTEREPFRYRALGDNRHHIVKEGDSLFNLAGRYFRGFTRPAGLWWTIADFQPAPIIDPTLTLTIGRVVVVPSERTVSELIFSPERAREIVP